MKLTKYALLAGLLGVGLSASAMENDTQENVDSMEVVAKTATNNKKSSTVKLQVILSGVKIPKDINILLLCLSLRYPSLVEKLQGFGPLRQVCRVWNILLHNKQVLQRVFADYPTIDSLITSPMYLGLKGFIPLKNDTILMDLSCCDRLVKYQSVNNEKKRYDDSGVLVAFAGDDVPSEVRCVYLRMSDIRAFDLLEMHSRLYHLKNYCENSDEEILIIIDEFELLPCMSTEGDDDLKTLATLLAIYLCFNNAVCRVMACTTRPEDIDERFLSRIDSCMAVSGTCDEQRRSLQLYVDAFFNDDALYKKLKNKKYICEQDVVNATLDQSERRVLLQQLIDQNFKHDQELKLEVGVFADEALDEISAKLNQYPQLRTYRFISKLQKAALETDDKKITTALITKVMNDMFPEKNHDQDS